MSTSNISTLLRAVSAEDTAALKARLVGDVVAPEDDEYEAARRVHNLRFDRKPALVVRAWGAADVAESVKFARARNYEVAVRGGGHSGAGFGSIDGGLVVDLSRMNGVVIDAERRIARVQAGATSADLAIPAHAYGLSVSTGDTASVGLGGLITGGGIGWMARKHGLTIDNLISAEVVTADGQVVRASAHDHSDLFWAIRGGGGNFGVVTEFELKLWRDGAVYGGTMALPATPEVIQRYLEFALAAPDELTTIAKVIKAPPLPFVPAEDVGRPVLMVSAVYAGSGRAGTRAIQPLRRLARPIGEAMGSMPYPQMFEQTARASIPAYSFVRSGFADALTEDTLRAAIKAVEDSDFPGAMIQLRPLGGAIARVSSEATAFAHRNRNFLATVIASSPKERDSATREAWVARTWAGLRPEISGAFASFLGGDEGSRIREAYPPTTYARLACVKAKYDPENVFHFNQNIRPGSTAGALAA